ncbi:MAG: murein transglycosylase A, partial [Methyloligellaceae bacterium]
GSQSLEHCLCVCPSSMMRAWILKPLLIVFSSAVLAALALWSGARIMNERAPVLGALAFSGIDGWESDDHGQAFAAFHRSCARIEQVAKARAKAGKGKSDYHPLTEICEAALDLGEKIGGAAAREFFQTRFTPHRYPGGSRSGFVTGYYEPELDGARARSKRFSVPVYRVPGDLVQLYPDAERAARNHEMTYARKTAQGLVPYYERKEIEQGALDGRNLEILYLENWADAFYMHVQGSGRVVLQEGGHVRLSFAAKNGHPYTSIGKLLIERGALSQAGMSMAAVRGWLDANPGQARELMWENRAYIFFRELSGQDSGEGPVGAQGAALTPRRSLAVDTSIHALGTPVWVNAPGLDVHGLRGFRHLMIAQDAGSAIRGEQRGDIFWGSGAQAGDIAGATRHKAEFIILLPNSDSPAG